MKVSLRLVAVPFHERLKHPIVVDNRPGAGGNVASEIVVKGSADGHVLLGTVDTAVKVNRMLDPESFAVSP